MSVSGVESLGPDAPQSPGLDGRIDPAGIRRWRWRRAAAIARTGVARYAKVGDSISAGQGLQPSTQSPPVIMAAMASTLGIPLRGTSVIMNPRTRYADSRLLFVGSWREYQPGALTTIAESTTAGDAVTLTANVAEDGDYVVRVVHSADSGSFTVSVDGEVPIMVEPDGSGALHVTEISLPGAGAGDHTVAVTVSDAKRSVRVAGVGIEPMAGIAYCDFGISMSTTADWIAGHAWYSALEHVRAWGPDLTIIALMTNDAHGLAVPPADYRANLEAMATALIDHSDVVLEAQIPGDPARVDLSPYREALFDVARRMNLPVLDLFDRWGSFDEANRAGLMADAFHPTLIGATDIAAAEHDVFRI